MQQIEKTLEAIPELFGKALRVKLNGKAYWNYVRKLRMCGSRQTFLIGKRFCLSPDEHRRTLGIDVLCQLRRYDTGRPPASGRFSDAEPVFRQASIRLIRSLLRDRRVAVLLSAIYGLGHLADPDRARWLSRFAGHRDRDVRFAVTVALGGNENPLAIRTLLALTEDRDARTRDWATFGIGDLMEKDSPQIREALFRRVRDRCRDARYEALVGLAKRKDARAVEHILHDLLAKNPRVYTLRAAREFGRPVFFPALQRLWNDTKRRGKTNAYWASEFKDAIRAWKPARNEKRLSSQIQPTQ